jgi:hypothetical protein
VATAQPFIESPSVEAVIPTNEVVPAEADSVIVDATLVEAFFSEDAEEKSDNPDGPREDEIL